MSFPRFAFLGVVSLSAGVWTACGGTVAGNSSGATTGSGGGTTTDTMTTTDTTTTPIVDAGPDVDHGNPSTMYPAPFPAPPQVAYYGGPVLSSPKFVPVFFSNDDATYVQQLTDFDTKVGGSKYWATAVGEYGVGAGTATPVVALTEAAPATIDDSAIQTWLAGKLNGNDPAWPVNDANTVYVLHYPQSTTITSGGSSSCQAFGGYHSNITLDGAHSAADAAYAVIPRCLDFPPLTGIDAITGTESHELAEAATDPYPMTQPAYAMVDDAHVYWSRVLGGGETGDMCAQFKNVWNKWPDLPYTVQSIWSNAAAKAGHDPCQPTNAMPYVAAAPLQKDNISTTYFGQTVNVKGVKIPVGATGDIEIDLFSDGPTTGPFTVSVTDATAAFGGTANLDIKLDKTTGVNGEKLHATVTVMKAGKHNTETFLVTAKLGSQEAIWVGLVGN